MTGDINGDGDVTLTDFVQFKSFLLNKAKPSDLQAAAGDLNGDNEASLTDFIALKSFLLGKGTVKPY